MYNLRRCQDVKFIIEISGSIYDVIETTTVTTTTVTTTVTAEKENEAEDKKEPVITSDGEDERRKQSLKKEMNGFLRIVTKFTNISDLPNDPEIGQLDFRIRSVFNLN